MFEKIQAIAADVDGVLTDGTFLWGTNGEEFKRFSFADVTGIALAREAGLALALISGESSPAGMHLVQRFADKLKIVNVYKGCHDKAAAVREFAEKNQLSLNQVCFVGDDVADLCAMELVGLAVAPADGRRRVKDKAHFVTTACGGCGVLREVIDAILDKRTAAPAQR